MDHPPTPLRPESSPNGGLNPRFAVGGRVAVRTAATFVEARRPGLSLPTRRQSATATGPPEEKDLRRLGRRLSFSGTDAAPEPAPRMGRRVAGGHHINPPVDDRCFRQYRRHCRRCRGSSRRHRHSKCRGDRRRVGARRRVP